MNSKILLLVFFICIITIIAAQDNHMDIMTTITGEHNFAHMGWVMTTLDWNGDSYDDLIVDSNNWKPEEYQSDPYIMPFGKLYVYLGGPNFDNIPEITFQGSYENEFWATFSMCNAGDMNNDGYDDLALFRATMYEGNNDQHYDLQLCVFLGGANPDTIPDYIITFPREEWNNEYCSIRGLGDINLDGFDDLGYSICGVNGSQPVTFCILMGGSGVNFGNTVFQETGSQNAFSTIIGLGDVNGDGIDDFGIGYLSEYVGWIQRIMLYYGSETGVYSDSVVVAQENIGRVQIYPAGDINHDGYDDFVTYFSIGSSRLYWGGQEFNPTNYIDITPTYNGDVAGDGFGIGDVNGDGTKDIMGTNVSQGTGFGDALLWMCGVPMNGTPDLYIPPPDLWPYDVESEMFGWCLTMGDYNSDGYCDAAISAPFDYGGGAGVPGFVFIYAGNRQLNDPTPIADVTQTPVIPQLKLYPNPLQPNKSNLNVRFIQLTPLPPSSRGVSTFEIYNIRGQKVKSFTLSAEQTKSGSANYNLNDLSSGIYVCVFTNGELELKGKITIIR